MEGRLEASSSSQSAGACENPFTGHVECWDVVWRGLVVLFLKVKEHQIQEQVCPSRLPLLGLSMSVLSSGWDYPELSGVQMFYFCWYWLSLWKSFSMAEESKFRSSQCIVRSLNCSCD